MKEVKPFQVVCVDDSWSKYPGRYSLPDGPLNRGSKYTVTGVFEHVNFGMVKSYKLKEKTVIDLDGGETGFLCGRFVAAEYYAMEFFDSISEQPHDLKALAL
jgi:hypothetical protein